MSKAVLLISHGSRFAKTKEEVSLLVGKLATLSKVDIFEYAFLELETPSIPDGIDLCVTKGATQVIILLNFLNSGRHVDEDIPQIVKDAKQRHPHVQFSITQPVGQHQGIANLFCDLIAKE